MDADDSSAGCSSSTSLAVLSVLLVAASLLVVVLLDTAPCFVSAVELLFPSLDVEQDTINKTITTDVYKRQHLASRRGGFHIRPLHTAIFIGHSICAAWGGIACGDIGLL